LPHRWGCNNGTSLITLILNHSNIAFSDCLWMSARSWFSLSAARCIELTMAHAVNPSSVRQTCTQPSSRVLISRLYPVVIVSYLLLKFNQPFLVKVTDPREFFSLRFRCCLDHVEVRLTLIFVHYLTILTRRNSWFPVSNHSSRSSSFQPSRPRRSSGMSNFPSMSRENFHFFLKSLSKSYSSLSLAS